MVDQIYSPWLEARTAQGKRTPPATLGLSDRALANFILPQREIMNRAAAIVKAQRAAEADAERIARERLEEMTGKNDGVVVTTPADVRARRADAPKQGKYALLPKDERKRAHPDTPVYMDTTAGETPMWVVGGPGEHWQDLKDAVDESRYYGLDSQELSDRPDVHGAYVRAAEKAENRRKGATSGYARLDKDGRPDYSNG